MPYLLVLLVSLLVGVGAYLVTVVRGSPSAPGSATTRRSSDSGQATHQGRTIHRPGTCRSRPGDRPPRPAPRALGVVLLVAISMAVLAFAIYEIGHLINRTIEAFLE